MRCGIALGSNVGDRLQNLRQAREQIVELNMRDRAVKQSKIYETEPVGAEPGAAPFLNAVVEIHFDGHPIALLDKLQAVEAQLGRPSKRPRNAPRTIDLDILYAGNLALSNDEVMIPHP